MGSSYKYPCDQNKAQNSLASLAATLIDGLQSCLFGKCRLSKPIVNYTAQTEQV